MATKKTETNPPSNRKNQVSLNDDKIHAIFEAASALTSLCSSGTVSVISSEAETEAIPQKKRRSPFISDAPKKLQNRHLKAKVRHLPDHKKPNAALTFPEKLMDMMDLAEEKLAKGDTNYCVAWQPDGLSFIIRHPENFTRDVLTLFFKQTKFSSFTRKLYRWGFRQVNRGSPGASANPNEPVVFGNEYFQRDQRSLISKMRSVTAAGAKRTVTSNTSTVQQQHIPENLLTTEACEGFFEANTTTSRKRKESFVEESEDATQPASPLLPAEGEGADDQSRKRRFLQMALDCADKYAGANRTAPKNVSQPSTSQNDLAASINALQRHSVLKMRPSMQNPEQILSSEVSSLMGSSSLSSSFALCPGSAAYSQLGVGSLASNTNTLANSLLLKSHMSLFAAQRPPISLESALSSGLGRNGLFVPPPQTPSANLGSSELIDTFSGADIVNNAIDALRFAS